MLTYKLVHLTEYHADNLAASLLRRVEQSPRAGSYRNVSPQELKKVVSEIYHHLGTWLVNKTETDVELRYRQRYVDLVMKISQRKSPSSTTLGVLAPFTA